MPDVGSDQDTPQPAQVPQIPGALCVLLAVTAVVRCVGITRPLLGNFATKNVVYAMIARNWAQGNADLWHPTLDLLCGGQRGWHMVEFPVSAYLTAGLWQTLGGSLDVWGRATAVVFSLGSVALLYLFVRRHHGQTAAMAAGLALAFSPVSIIYGQSFMLEASLVFLTLATLDALDRWLGEGSSWWLVLTGIWLALLLLTKIYMLVLLLPIAVMVARSTRAPRRTTREALAVVLLVAIFPAVIWYAYAYRIAAPDNPLAERIFYSIRESTSVHRLPHPLLFSGDFYRQVVDDLAGVVLTPIGLVLMLAGLLDRRWREYAAWLVAMIVLMLALPRKFYEMNYYYLVVLPPLCILIGLGWQVVWQRIRPGKLALAVLAIAVLGFSLRHAAGPAWTTPEEDRPVLRAAAAAEEMTEDNEPVVTMHGTSIDLLYYTGRRGWALDPKMDDLPAALDRCRRHGARIGVVIGDEAPPSYPILREGDRFSVFRLTPPPSGRACPTFFRPSWTVTSAERTSGKPDR